MARNRTLAASAAVLLMLLGKVVVDGQRAALAIRRLSASAPVFAARAQELLKDGDFAGALEAAENAVDLEPGNASNQVVRGNALQVIMRLEDAKKAYGRALAMGGAEGAQDGLQLTDAVLAAVAKNGEAKAKVALYEGLSGSGRQMEALAFGKGLGGFLEGAETGFVGDPRARETLGSEAAAGAGNRCADEQDGVYRGGMEALFEGGRSYRLAAA